MGCLVVTTESPSWRRTVRMLHERNGAVEITPANVGGDDQMAPTYRTRLLRFDVEGLLIERPLALETGRYLARGSPWRVLAVDEVERWELLCGVDDLRMHQLNERCEVAAVLMSVPREVRSGQRRNYFRVSTTGAGLPPVYLIPIAEPAATTEDTAAAGDGDITSAARVQTPTPIRAKLLNIGGGGIGVETSPHAADAMVRFTLFHCELNLPTVGEPLVVRARLVHIDRQRGGTHYLGLSFMLEDRPDRWSVVDHICRFTAWCQRQQLRRLNREL